MVPIIAMYPRSKLVLSTGPIDRLHTSNSPLTHRQACAASAEHQAGGPRGAERAVRAVAGGGRGARGGQGGICAQHRDRALLRLPVRRGALRGQQGGHRAGGHRSAAPGVQPLLMLEIGVELQAGLQGRICFKVCFHTVSMIREHHRNGLICHCCLP